MRMETYAVKKNKDTNLANLNNILLQNIHIEKKNNNKEYTTHTYKNYNTSTKVSSNFVSGVKLNSDKVRYQCMQG